LRLTASPDFLFQLPMVASVIDSPTAGILTSIFISHLLDGMQTLGLHTDVVLFDVMFLMSFFKSTIF
jgi:hypothetical protein